MKCPCCGKEMVKGAVQSAREIFFTTMSHELFFTPVGSKDVSLSSHNWTRPTCVAYHCEECKKVVIDYAEEVD